ncbi:MAG: hypothetical protein AAGJ81_04915 [Verrucomicrobiota bacterium]
MKQGIFAKSLTFFLLVFLLSRGALFSDEAKQRALIEFISENCSYIRVFDLFPSDEAWNYGPSPQEIELRIFEIPDSQEKREKIIESFHEKTRRQSNTETKASIGDPFSADFRSISQLEYQEERVVRAYQMMLDSLTSSELGYYDTFILDLLPLGNQRFPLEFLNDEMKPIARAYIISSTGLVLFSKAGATKKNRDFENFVVFRKTLTDSFLDITAVANQLLLPLWDVDGVVGKNSIILENNLIQVYGFVEVLGNGRKALFGRNSFLPLLDSSVDIPLGGVHLVGRLRFAFQPKITDEDNEHILERFLWFQPLRIIRSGRTLPSKPHKSGTKTEINDT